MLQAILAPLIREGVSQIAGKAGADKSMQQALGAAGSAAAGAVPEMLNLNQSPGEAARKFMKEAYPGTTPWEQLGANAGGSVGAAREGTKAQEKLQRREHQNRVELEHIKGQYGVRQATAAIGGEDTPVAQTNKMKAELSNTRQQLLNLREQAKHTRSQTELTKIQTEMYQLLKSISAGGSIASILGLLFGGGVAGRQISKFLDQRSNRSGKGDALPNLGLRKKRGSKKPSEINVTRFRTKDGKPPGWLQSQKYQPMKKRVVKSGPPVKKGGIRDRAMKNVQRRK